MVSRKTTRGAGCGMRDAGCGRCVCVGWGGVGWDGMGWGRMGCLNRFYSRETSPLILM